MFEFWFVNIVVNIDVVGIKLSFWIGDLLVVIVDDVMY